MNHKALSTYLALLGWVPAAGHIPEDWYGAYYVPTKTLVQEYLGAYAHYGMDELSPFDDHEMVKHENCYVTWDDLTAPQVYKLHAFITRHFT